MLFLNGLASKYILIVYSIFENIDYVSPVGLQKRRALYLESLSVLVSFSIESGRFSTSNLSTADQNDIISNIKDVGSD
ncbi:MAG: hypothetical protein HPY87_00040 [Fervidobacterium sp.]|nr:hypothetical protein [Fervidobacterium sp.]